MAHNAAIDDVEIIEPRSFTKGGARLKPDSTSRQLTSVTVTINAWSVASSARPASPTPVFSATIWSFRLFDIRQHPATVQEGFLWRVESEIGEPAASGFCGDPVLRFVTLRFVRANVDID